MPGYISSARIAIDIAAPMTPAMTANTRYMVPMSCGLSNRRNAAIRSDDHAHDRHERDRYEPLSLLPFSNPALQYFRTLRSRRLSVARAKLLAYCAAAPAEANELAGLVAYFFFAASTQVANS